MAEAQTMLSLPKLVELGVQRGMFPSSLAHLAGNATAARSFRGLEQTAGFRSGMDPDKCSP